MTITNNVMAIEEKIIISDNEILLITICNDEEKGRTLLHNTYQSIVKSTP